MSIVIRTFSRGPVRAEDATQDELVYVMRSLAEVQARGCATMRYLGTLQTADRKCPPLRETPMPWDGMFG